MNDLLPISATTQERALSLATSRAAAVDVNFLDLWNPQTCRMDLLPWLAWTLSVDTWDPTWGDAVKRSVVSSAVEVARRKGTKKSVSDSLASFGASLFVREWFEKSPRGVPHTFEINLVSSDLTVAMQDSIVAKINRTKPLRSHYTINYGASLTGGINVVGLLRAAVFVRLDATAFADPGEIPPPAPGLLNTDGAPLRNTNDQRILNTDQRISNTDQPQ